MWLEPLRNRLLVIPDTPPSKVGSIHLPENVELKAERGTIRRVSPGCHRSFREGRCVLFMPRAGRTIGIDGVEHKLLSTAEILGFVWDLGNVLESHPNLLLVRRDERGVEAGVGIILPDSARVAQSAIATVMAVGLELQEVFSCGDRVLLGGGIGKRVKFHGETFYSCSEAEIIGRIRPDQDGAVNDLGEDTFGRYHEEVEDLIYRQADHIVDEGVVE